MTDLTCAIEMVCEALSSPIKVIPEGVLAVTIPETCVPSRIVTIACGPLAVDWLEHEVSSPVSSMTGNARVSFDILS